MPALEPIELEMQPTEAEAYTSVAAMPSINPAPIESRLRLMPILTLALILRSAVLAIVIAQGPRAWFYKQALELSALAQSLLLGHGFSSPFGGSTGPSAFLAPGYPIFVALIFRIFGSYSTASAIAIMALQILLNVATVLATMLVAQRLFGARVANIAGILWAVSPVLLWLPVIFWESSFSTLALIAMIALALHCAEQPTLGKWAIMGIFAGIILLVNPALALALAAVLGWAAYQTKTSTRSGLVIAALLCAIVFSPWPIRNWQTLHAFVPFRSNMGYELWQGNRPASKGFFTESLHPNMNKAEFSRYASLGELGYMREKSQLAKDAIYSDPARFARLTLKRVGSFWTGFGGETYSAPQVAHMLLTTLLGFAGLVLMFRRKVSTALLFALPLILFPIPYYLTHPDPRFRLVLDPVMTILSAYAIVVVYGRSRAASELPGYSQ